MVLHIFCLLSLRNAVQAAHDAAAAELQELQRSAAAGQAATEAEAAAVKAGDEAAYAAEHAELAKQVRH
jgi:hypothetical protein